MDAWIVKCKKIAFTEKGYRDTTQFISKQLVQVPDDFMFTSEAEKRWLDLEENEVVCHWGSLPALLLPDTKNQRKRELNPFKKKKRLDITH